MPKPLSVKPPSEKEIQNAILEWLATQPQCMAWPIQNSATFDRLKKVYRSPPKHWRKGVSDILGLWRGHPLAIEVKSSKGRPSPEQLAFLAEFAALGGVSFIARSLDEVIAKLNAVPHR